MISRRANSRTKMTKMRMRVRTVTTTTRSQMKRMTDQSQNKKPLSASRVRYSPIMTSITTLAMLRGRHHAMAGGNVHLSLSSFTFENNNDRPSDSS